MAFQYAGHYGEEAYLDGDGNLLPGREVRIDILDTDTPAILWTDRTKTTQASNPVTINSRGNLEFWADPDDYDSKLITGGVPEAPATITVHPDKDDAIYKELIESRFSGDLVPSESPFRNHHEIGGQILSLRFTLPLESTPDYSPVLIDYMRQASDGSEPVSILSQPAQIDINESFTFAAINADLEDGDDTWAVILQNGEAAFIGAVPGSFATFGEGATGTIDPDVGFTLPNPAAKQDNDQLVAAICVGNTEVPVFFFDGEHPWDGDRRWTNYVPGTEGATIAAGSDSEVLPGDGTIALTNDAFFTALPSQGTVYVEIDDSPLTITAINYTGKGAGTLTGCTGGTGTLATGMRVIGVYQWGSSADLSYKTIARHLYRPEEDVLPVVTWQSQFRAAVAAIWAVRGANKEVDDVDGEDPLIDVASSATDTTGDETAVATGAANTSVDEQVVFAIGLGKYASGNAPGAVTTSASPAYTKLGDVKTNRAANVNLSLGVFVRVPNPAASVAVGTTLDYAGTVERSINTVVTIFPNDFPSVGANLEVKGYKV